MTFTARPEDRSEARRWGRFALNWSGVLANIEGQDWAVRIVDGGRGGFGLQDCPPLDVGQTVELRLEKLGTFKCRVAWRELDRCGLAILPFDGALTDADIGLLAVAIENAPASGVEERPADRPSPTRSSSQLEDDSSTSEALQAVLQRLDELAGELDEIRRMAASFIVAKQP
jgi:hypothetical protein